MNLRFVFSLIVSLLSLLPAAAQDLTRNWIRERIFLDAEGKKCVTSVQYFDGIGRETLLLTDGLSPGGDVAGALTGESFAGRTSAKWLPATGLTGFDFLTPERVKSLAVSSHEGDRKHTETTAFDANGNITRLVRWADYAPMLNTAADVLYYTLDGNRPLSISDRGVSLAYAESFDFKNRGRSGEYAYDGNGRLVSDPYKGMTVTYADWGTPEKITFDDGNHTAFTYTASGEKLKTEWRSGAANLRAGEGSPAVQAAVINSEELFGPFVCRDGRLDKFLFDGGFCELSSGGVKYRYFVRDRLGSVRSVADEDGNVLQQNLYYARGGAWGDVCTAPGFQSYKYCGKYLDRKHGLDLYDYGARLYDPAAAFWTSPDPLCEKYYNISPYAFCNDNPVTFIDPDGRKWKTLEDKEKATRIQEISMFHVRSLEKAIQKIKRKIEVANNDISLSEKARNRKIKRYKENLSELQYKKNLLSHLHDGISILENSSQTYAYKRIYNGIASIVWDGNTIYIENFGTIGSYAHETVHAIQRERGFIIFKEGKAFANMLELFEIEKEAYQTEYSITNGLIPYSETSTPTNIFGITPKWFRGLKFNGTDVY